MLTNRRSELLATAKYPMIFFAPAIVWGFLIFYFSLMPGNKVPDALAEMNDKILHGFIYFVSAALIYLGFVRYNFNNAITGTALWVIVGVCVTAGTIIEVLQHFWVENRNGDWQDFVANTLGSLLCVLLFRVIHGLRA